MEDTLARVIPEPDSETAVLAYTEGDFTILLFSPKAVNLVWILLQAKGARACEKPNPGYADRVVIGDPGTWGNMVKQEEKKRR